MATIHDFAPGDFLIFQLESGYGLLRVLDFDPHDNAWHVAGYRDLFLDPEALDRALDNAASLQIENPHIALTNRAFESTQVAKMRNIPLTEDELRPYEEWKRSGSKQIYDRSIRLLLGLR
jgi:hypothetical protein